MADFLARASSVRVPTSLASRARSGRSDRPQRDDRLRLQLNDAPRDGSRRPGALPRRSRGLSQFESLTSSRRSDKTPERRLNEIDSFDRLDNGAEAELAIRNILLDLPSSAAATAVAAVAVASSRGAVA